LSLEIGCSPPQQGPSWWRSAEFRQERSTQQDLLFSKDEGW